MNASRCSSLYFLAAIATPHLGRCDDRWNPSGGVLGDVGDPGLIRLGGGEVALDVVVVDRRPRGLPRAAAALADRRRPQPLLGAQPPDPAFTDGVTGSLELVGQEPVAELRVVTVGVDQGVGEIGVLQLALADRLGEPGVERLPRVAQHPAGQPHRDPLGGQVTDQRVAHFGSEPAAK
jgi:hypothetical protein